MIYKDCDNCSGSGKIIKEEVIFHEESEAYQSSLKKIKALDPNLSDEDAKNILNDELKKLDKKEKKLSSKRRIRYANRTTHSLST